MAVRQIRLDGDPILRKKSREIEKIDDRNINLRTLEKPIILTKNGSFEPQIVNGADSGIRTHVYRNHNPRS